MAVLAGGMVVIGLGLMLFIGSMNRSADPPAPATNVASNQNTSQGPSPSSTLPAIRKTQPPPSASTDGPAEGSGDEGSADDGRPADGPRFAAGSPSSAIAGTTSTFDADGDITTIQVQPMSLTVEGKKFEMTMKVTHEGRDIRTASQIGAEIRISGNFTGITTDAAAGDPRLTIEADGRDEFFLPPSDRDKGQGEDGADIPPASSPASPKWVEFTVGRAELKAIAHAKSLRTTLGGTLFEFSDEQRKLFLALIPVAAASGDDRPLPPEEKPDDTEPDAAGGDDGDAPVEKEIMDEKEIMKK